jgi:carboxypeptidase PM20D1
MGAAESRVAAGHVLDAMAPHTSPLTRAAIANSWLFEPLLVRELSATPQGAAMLQTTIAPTMLQGSPKGGRQRADAALGWRIRGSAHRMTYKLRKSGHLGR